MSSSFNKKHTPLATGEYRSIGAFELWGALVIAGLFATVAALGLAAPGLAQAQQLDAREAAQVQAPPQKTPPSPPPEGQAPAATTSSALFSRPPSAPPAPIPENSANYHVYKLRTVGVVTASLGALAVMGGVYLGLRSWELSDEVTRDTAAGAFSQSKDDERRRDQTLQWVGYGVGAAALITGCVIYLRAGKLQPETPTATVTPVIGPNLAGGFLRLIF